MDDNTTLSKEELQIEQQRRTGDYVQVDNFEKEKACYQAGAKVFNKRRKITISIVERNLEQLKLEAAQAGIPYQTYINSILHKYITGQFVEKKELV